MTHPLANSVTTLEAVSEFEYIGTGTEVKVVDWLRSIEPDFDWDAPAHDYPAALVYAVRMGIAGRADLMDTSTVACFIGGHPALVHDSELVR